MSTIPQLFGSRTPQSDSDDVVLAPPSINPRSTLSLQQNEFRIGRPAKGSFDDGNIGKEEGETLGDNHESGQSLKDE